MIFLDTHAAIYLLRKPGKVSRKVQFLLDKGQLVLSPMARLELDFLHETQSIHEEPQVLWDMLRTDLDVTVETEGWARAAQIALVLNWTRDPFDRLIVAHAMVWSAPLLTRDTVMHEHYHLAFWDEPPLTSAS